MYFFIFSLENTHLLTYLLAYLVTGCCMFFFPCFFNTLNWKESKSPYYLFQLIPPNNNVFAARSSQSGKILSFKTRHNFFKNSFFPAAISEWNSLDINTQNSPSTNLFKKGLLKFIRPESNSTYNINDTKRLKLLARLWFGVSHLGDTNSGTTFKTVYPQCVFAVRILKYNSLSPSLSQSLWKENPFSQD